MELGSGTFPGLIFAQTAENVFYINDGVVHHFTKGDHQATQGDGVDRDAEFFEHDDSREQREGNGRQRDAGDAHTAQQQEQNHGHQNTAEEQ